MDVAASGIPARDPVERTPARPRLRIAVALPSDFEERPTGGMLTAVKSLLSQLPSTRFEVVLFGLTWKPQEPVGCVACRTVNDEMYPFIPLYQVPVENLDRRRPVLPLRLRTFWACLVRGRRLIDRSFDIVYLHAPEFLPLVVPKRHLVVYTVHGIEEAGAEYSRYGFARTRPVRALYRRIIRMLIARSDRVLCVDAESYHRYLACWPDRVDEIRFTPLSVDRGIFKPVPDARTPHLKARLGIHPDMRVVLYVGRLTRLKGVHLIVNAFAAAARTHPDLQLAIVGNGEEDGALRAQVAECRLTDRVLFVGKVPHNELPNWYNAADVCVMASERESVGLTVLEALACGTPVVATRVGVAPLVIRDGVNGVLIHQRTTTALANGIEVALNLGPHARDACVDALLESSRTSVPLGEIILDLLASRSMGSDRQSPNPVLKRPFSIRRALPRAREGRG